MSPNLEGRRHSLADIFHERTNFRFIDRSWRWLLVSGVVVAVSIGSLATRGLNLGIDFTGGLAWEVPITGSAPSVEDVRDSLRPLGLADAKISIRTSQGDREDVLLVQAEEVPEGESREVSAILAEDAQADVSEVSVTEVSATWGEKITEQALRALIVFFVLVAVYLTFRFEWKMAIAAVVAVLHDILVTVGVYSVTRFEVTPPTVIALLTILGFSLYDTVVVFDKVRENAQRLGTVRGETYGGMVNRSLNEVLMRSLNTSLVALLPVISLLVVGSWMFGAVSLRDFALALLVGLAAGTYSSLFVAAPLLAWWKEREPRYRALAERVAVKAPEVPVPTPVAASPASPARPELHPPSAPASPERAEPSPSPRPVGASPGVTPRPRQPRRRKRRR